MLAMVTSFPDASKIASSFGKNLATPGTTRREPAGASHSHAPTTICRKWVQILRRQTPALTFPMGLDMGSGCTSSGCRRSTRVRQDASARLLSDGSSISPLVWGAPAHDLLLLYVCFPLPLAQASTAPCRCPQGLICSGTAPHKHYLPRTLHAVGQLYHKSCIPLVRFQLPFSATCKPGVSSPPQNIILITSDHWFLSPTHF